MVTRSRSLLLRNEYDNDLNSSSNENTAEDVPPPDSTMDQHRGHATSKEKSMAQMYTDKFGTDDDQYDMEDIDDYDLKDAVFANEQKAVPMDFQEVFETGRQDSYYVEGKVFDTPGTLLRVSPPSSSSYAMEPGARMDAEQIAHVIVGAFLGIFLGTMLYRCVFGSGPKKGHPKSDEPWLNTAVSFQDEIKFRDEIPDDYDAYGTKYLDTAHALAPIDHGYKKESDDRYDKSSYESYNQDWLGGVGFENAAKNINQQFVATEEESIDDIMKEDSSSGRTRSINNILNNSAGIFRTRSTGSGTSTGRTRSIDIPDEI